MALKSRKTTPKKLKEKLWILCREITRARYRNKDGTWNCYTCDRRLDEPAKAQTGHFIPSAAGGGFLRYDLRNLRIQCYHCNINLGGNGSSFYRNLIRDEGKKYVDQLFKDKNRIIKLDSIYLESRIAEYQEVLSNLLSTGGD